MPVNIAECESYNSSSTAIEVSSEIERQHIANSSNAVTTTKAGRPVCAVRPILAIKQEDTNRPSNKVEVPQRVKDKLSGVTWYHGRKSIHDVRLLLDQQPTGTFLVRDSESANYMFSISSRTSRGTTSVRVAYDVTRQKFELDIGTSRPASSSPRFDCITDVVDYLMRISKSSESQQCLCIESDGRKDTPFLLTRPYHVIDLNT